MKHLIEIENLTFEYTREEDAVSVKALDGVSLSIEKGSFTAILGRNGSGKSTLAKNINGLLLPTEGTVRVGGFSTSDEDHIWEVRQTAGLVFQNPDNQLVASIVEDDVAFGPENLGIPPREIREKVDEALKAVNMYDHRKKAPHLLSGGQKQRVAIAGVLAMRPECIILDEPTAMLDPQGRKEILSTICRLNREEGITILLITHFMEEALPADRVIVMDQGKIAMDGTPKDVFSQQETLLEMGMELPFAVEMALRLRNKGITIPREIIEENELVTYLCQYE